MSEIAKIVLESTPDLVLDYLVPEELAAELQMGSRVSVPCGKKHFTGYIIGFVDNSSCRNLRKISKVVSKKSFLSPNMLKLAEWMARYYCTSVSSVIQSVLPAAVRRSGAGHKQLLNVMLKQEPVDGVKLSGKQQAVVSFLKENGACLLKDLTARLNVSVAPVKALEKKDIVEIRAVKAARAPLAGKNILPTKPHTLMPEQERALELIMDAFSETLTTNNKQPTTVLLHGVTGSGKTEVYMQAIDRVINTGRGVIVLVPEISLTPQTVRRFHSRFGDRIAVLHSHLSSGERHDEWHRICDGEADIVIGARSAVFAPVKDLGMIVVDEEHEHSYKQEDAPRYNARDVAVMRGHIEGRPVVLGSATPSLESWRNALAGKYALARLTKRVDDRKMPVIRVIDMRRETEIAGHVSVFSKTLVDAIRHRLDSAEQVILFLNRRGFSTSLICPHCGYVASCDDCSVSFTYHRPDDTLRCHICGAQRKVPQKCPSCNDPSFKYSGIGTQRVENILRKFFPNANVERVDSDTMGRKDSYDRILGDFRSGKIDILIGTQMIAKGLHFPNVTLVGVIYADLSLHMPDFRAGERTFQLLAQVAGRAGRGDRPGEVIVQTYTPQNPAIQAARRLDYDGFCDQELAFRQELDYPPFSHLMCITIRGAAEDKVAFCASSIARLLKKNVKKGIKISDAVPAPLARARKYYRYQVMVRGRPASAIADVVCKAVDGLSMPDGIFVSLDMDAISLL